jgi:fluoroacetyl-CoA thioesterase
MPKPSLQKGITFKQTIPVTERITVPAMSEFFTGFSDMPAVFATAYLVGFAEWTCIEALRTYLNDDERTVGTDVDLSHSAATPIGLIVTAEVELTEVEERKLRFKIVCSDEKEIICEGFHKRFVINYNKFAERVQKKLS